MTKLNLCLTFFSLKGSFKNFADTTQIKLVGVSNEDLHVGQWYHTAFAWDQDSLYLYLNGILKASKKFSWLTTQVWSISQA